MIHRSPYVVAAAMQFDQRLAAMPDYLRRTQFLYEALAAHPGIKRNPSAPQTNMLHLHLPVSPERALAIRRELAEEHGIWMFNRIASGVLPATSSFELYVGDSLLAVSDEQVHTALSLFAKSLVA